MDINPSRTLQKESAREEKDERHICPLQLDVIERAVQLWSNKGDVVLSPFMGIGIQGYVSVGMGRKFVGIELKESYYDQAILNLAMHKIPVLTYSPKLKKQPKRKDNNGAAGGGPSSGSRNPTPGPTILTNKHYKGVIRPATVD